MPSLRRRSSDHSTSWPRPCSSKAVYRIATVLNLEPLQQLAFVAIKQLIRKDNVLDELFTHFAASHKEIMQMEIAVVIQYWTHLRDSHFQRKMEEMAEGEYPFGDIIVAELVKRLVVVDADE
ncbi:hypothetical protein K474DRAFT_1656894 [Panus rudis PR-1116 ss-1]|nr:hypothetical protein K474DRAFT_1656894 [Panus rudis PR-1116 ss-1]